MKKAIALIISIISILSFVITAFASTTMSSNEIPAKAPAAMKGTWLSFVDMEEYFKGRDRKTFDNNFLVMCKTVQKNGGDTIFVHVRSHNDAMYPSAIYPWSEKVYEGKNPGFNPLADMVAIAHGSGLKIHAWINPYGYRQGEISGNPALATTENIVAGVEEILSRYKVDGIHFDDYFPPVGAEVINDMILKVHQVCVNYGKIFGIAPQGNIENNIAMGADVNTWLSVPGYIDYIAPQIYWTDNYGDGSKTMSSDRLKQWSELNKIKVPMYVGMALYRAGNKIDEDPGWLKQSDNLAKQYETAKKLGFTGYILYNTKSQLYPNDNQVKELNNLKSK